jgi:hypothetical protein
MRHLLLFHSEPRHSRLLHSGFAPDFGNKFSYNGNHCTSADDALAHIGSSSFRPWRKTPAPFAHGEEFPFTFGLHMSDRGGSRNLSIAPSIMKIFKLSEPHGDLGLEICAFMTTFDRPVATWTVDLVNGTFSAAEAVKLRRFSFQSSREMCGV